MSQYTGLCKSLCISLAALNDEDSNDKKKMARGAVGADW